jgi:resorcinol 4-hydroxylase (FADH2)
MEIARMTSAFSDAEQQPASPKLDAFARLLDAAVQLRPRLPKRVRQIELDRRVSADVTNLLKEVVLNRVAQLRRFGGYKPSLKALRRLAFELGEASGRRDSVDVGTSTV